MKELGKSEGRLDMFKRTRLQILNIKHKAPLYEKANKPNPAKTPSQITHGCVKTLTSTLRLSSGLVQPDSAKPVV